MSWRVRLTAEAEADLERLFDFILTRELARESGADLWQADAALSAIRQGLSTLSSSPFTCRKAQHSPFLRELIIPFGSAGYVALFEIEDSAVVTVLAVRHQRESDYH